MKGIQQYVELAIELGERTNNGVQDSPVSSSAAEARLKVHLKQTTGDDGETLHGFCSDCAITLALTEADLTEMMENVGWARKDTALYYLQLAKVLNHDGASGRFTASPAKNVVAPQQDVNRVKRFVCAFPASEQRKRPAE